MLGLKTYTDHVKQARSGQRCRPTLGASQLSIGVDGRETNDVEKCLLARLMKEYRNNLRRLHPDY